MTEEERNRIISEDYTELILDYRNNPQYLEAFPGAMVQIINNMFAVVHLPVEQIEISRIGTFGYTAIPNVLGLVSEVSVQASRIPELRRIPALNLRGEGTLVAIIDTGIDYTNPVFLRPDGTTKITAIWDQTIQSVDRFPYNTNFGTEYRAEEINQALASANPLEVVPSTDDNGHGTMMAAVAAGNEVLDEGFAGVAPDAELVVVKLRPAKENLKNYLSIPEDVLCYQEDTIMWGIQYCFLLSRELGRPMVICIGLGTSQGAHEGRSPLAVMMNVLGDFPNIAFVTAAGNEGNTGRHYRGNIDPQIGYNTMELIVGEEDKGFSMEIWGDLPGIYSIDILSPSGEFIPRIAASLTLNRIISFIFEETIIYIYYQTVEAETGDQLIFLRFRNAAPGTWRFNVYSQSDLAGGFHSWLPMGDMISRNTYFAQPEIYTTLLSPGTVDVPITATAYNPIGGNLYAGASRGYTRNNMFKPDLAAPGVDYIAPNNHMEFVSYTGTGVAAAHTTGIAAMLMEWGTVRGNRPNLNTIEIKKFLIRGARRSANLVYPNRDWGYGILDIYNMFDILRQE
jgi:subtilisin family serine protease